jgi:tRNA(Ile)-lysidine synthase
LHLPATLGALGVVSSRGTGLALERLTRHLNVRFRQGGEQIKPRHSRHHRTLKYLLQDARVLPWWRPRIPLIFVDDKLIAVADLWVDDEWSAPATAQGIKIVWHDRPAITGETRT